MWSATPTEEQTGDNSIDLSFAHPTATSSPKPMDATYDIPMENLNPSTVSFILQEVTMEEGTMFSEEHSQHEVTNFSEDASQNATFLMQTDGQQDSISIREVLDVINNIQMDEGVILVNTDASNTLEDTNVSLNTMVSLSDPEHQSDVWVTCTCQSFKTSEEVNTELHQLQNEHEVVKANELADFLFHEIEVDVQNAQKPPKRQWRQYWTGADWSYMSGSEVFKQLEQIREQKKIDEQNWLNDTAPLTSGGRLKGVLVGVRGQQ